MSPVHCHIDFVTKKTLNNTFQQKSTMTTTEGVKGSGGFTTLHLAYGLFTFDFCHFWQRWITSFLPDDACDFTWVGCRGEGMDFRGKRWRNNDSIKHITEQIIATKTAVGHPLHGGLGRESPSKCL